MTATPVRLLTSDPDGFGLGMMLHWVPSQCSVSVAFVEEPTAQMSLGEMAATPFRELAAVPTLGLETTLHWPQLCARARTLVPPIRSSRMANTPTRTQWVRCFL